MTVRGVPSIRARGPIASGKVGSSLVRRLVGARDDPAKQRIRAWLSEMDDEKLLNFGLTAEEITILRGGVA